MNFGDVIKGIGGFICAVTVSSMEHLNEHNKKVNAYKDEFRKCNVSIEFGGSCKSKGKCCYLNQNTYLWLGRFWVYTYVYIFSDTYI